MIDEEGFRYNVGIIIVNSEGKLFWARRFGKNAWQFPQGGLHENEDPTDAMYRELKEEVGLEKQDVELITSTRDWFYYRLPHHFMRRNSHPKVIGQKQKWYLLKLISPENHIKLDLDQSPEFDQWKWVDYWQPLKEVIYFKRRVYRKALKEFEPFLRKLFWKNQRPRHYPPHNRYFPRFAKSFPRNKKEKED